MSERLYGVPTLHEELIADVCRGGFSENGFGAMLDGLGPRLGDPDACTELRRIVGRGRPDAWRVDLEKDELTIVEVEVGNPMADHVLTRWALLWLYLDSNDWMMRLLRVDRWGQITSVNCFAAFAYSELKRIRDRDRVGIMGVAKSVV